MNELKLKETDKADHFRFFVNGVDQFGEQEKSVYRHIIQVIDNGISI